MLYEGTTDRIISAAIGVHTALGPGLLESTYSACLCHAFLSRQIPFETQVKLPVSYEGATLDAGYRIDFLVEDRVIVELKAVERLLPPTRRSV